MLFAKILDISKLTIYPNPTSDYVIINSDTLGNYEYNVYDSSGKMVFEEKDKFDNKISLNGITKGIYFIEIISNEFSKTFKIIKN